MEKSYYDLDGQAKRCREISRLTTRYNLAYFDGRGRWIKPGWRPGMREAVWFAMNFLESGEPEAVRMANAIIQSQTYGPCHFTPMFAMLILKKYPALLEDKSVAVFRRYLEDSLDDFMACEHDFVGVNDNFPCMAAFIALMGGQMFHRPDLAEKGRERLCQLRDLLTRRGVASEYDSPTYAPGQIYPISQIANYIADEPVRRMALDCEERLWADLMGHVHRETWQVAGPFSRAYTVDSTGHTHQSRFLLYALFGDRLKINVRNTVFAAPDAQPGEVLHHSAPFLQISAGWLLNTTYHCPDYLAKLALEKQYPYEFSATTEFSSSTDASADVPPADPMTEEDFYEYPAGVGKITTFMTEDYALGTATREFHNGLQTDSFHILYRRRAPAERQRDVSTVYARYLFNGRQPNVNDCSLPDEGRKLALQSKNTAMVLYKPKLYGRHGVKSMRLALILPVLGRRPEEIRLGGRKLASAAGESVVPCSVYIKDGPVYLAFHPLALTDYGRKAAVRVEDLGNFVVVSFYNYEGTPRNFAGRGFLLTRSGFVAEVRSETEVGSFDRFVTETERFSIDDRYLVTPHSRQTYIRQTRYERPGLQLECEYSPVSEGIKLLAVNGKAVEYRKLEISGFDSYRLPFME